MKTLRITYLIVIAASLATVAWNYLVVQQELPDFDHMDFDYLVHHPEAEAALSNARHNSDLLGLTGTCLGGLGAILAAIAFIRTKTKLHLLFSIAGIVVALASFAVAFSHVM